MNQLGVIYPYLSNGMWVFDDPNVGLVQEPFIAGIDKIMDLMTANIDDAENGFRLIFSGGEFPGFTTYLTWVEQDKPLTQKDVKQGFQRGNWYCHPETQMEGWLCPALLKYFDEAPKTLYIKIEEAVGERPIYKRPKPIVNRLPSLASFGIGSGGHKQPGWWGRSRGNH